MEDTAEQARTVGAEHLEVSLSPAHPLSPRLAEGHRLLVKEHRFRRVAHPIAVKNTGDSKLDILGE